MKRVKHLAEEAPNGPKEALWILFCQTLDPLNLPCLEWQLLALKCCMLLGIFAPVSCPA